MGSEVAIRNEGGVDVSDPLFVTSKRRAADEAFVAKAIRDASFTSGVQQRRPGVKRYRIHGHEFRDTFRTTCKVTGVDQAVAEFFIGHSIDVLGYDKSPWVYPEHFREQYLLVEPYVCREEQTVRVQEERRKELEDRIKSLESSLARLTSELTGYVQICGLSMPTMLLMLIPRASMRSIHMQIETRHLSLTHLHASPML